MRNLGQRSETRAHLGKQIRNACEPYAGLQRRHQRQRRTKCVDDTLVRGCLRRTGRTDQRPAAAFLDGTREFEHHSGFTDARRSPDEHAGAPAARGPAPRLEQPFHLGVAADERQDWRTNRRRHGGRLERGLGFAGFSASDRLTQRERFGHRLRVEFQAKLLRETFVFGERAGPVAGIATHRHHLTHHVFAPRIERKDLLGPSDSACEIALPPRLRDELSQCSQKSVAAPLALGKDPFVVQRGQQLSAIEFDRFLEPFRIGRQPVELFDVEP